jgi:hypothetical protein
MVKRKANWTIGVCMLSVVGLTVFVANGAKMEAAGRPEAETVAPATKLLLDNFTKDTKLNTKLWTARSSFLTSLAAASSSPPASFVPPQLSFSSQSGMQMTGPTQDYETTGVQSLSTFAPPFTVVTYVTPTEGTANPFGIFLANAELTDFLTITANVSATYDGFWATAPNISELWQLGEQFSPPISPAFDSEYKIVVNVRSMGKASAEVEDRFGTVLGTVSGLQPGTGPFYLVLGQRIGDAQTGPQVADWLYVRVTTP